MKKIFSAVMALAATAAMTSCGNDNKCYGNDNCRENCTIERMENSADKASNKMKKDWEKTKQNAKEDWKDTKENP